MDRAVVLVAGWIADVEEPRSVRLPGHRARPRIRDAVAVAANRRAIDAGDDVQHGVLGPALADADGDQRAVVRRVVPVDGRRGVDARRRRIAKHHRVLRGIGGRPPGEHELLGARRALVAEQVVAAQRCVLQHRQLHQRDEPLVPHGASGNIEDRPRQLVLGGDPGGHVRIVTVLQPAVRVGNGGSVVGVDDVLAPGRRDRGRQRHVAERTGGGPISRGPCWGACRGSPWNGACGPCASWSSST